MLWLHITENLAMNLNCIFKHHVNIGLSQKHIICVNNKVNTFKPVSLKICRTSALCAGCLSNFKETGQRGQKEWWTLKSILRAETWHRTWNSHVQPCLSGKGELERKLGEMVKVCQTTQELNWQSIFYGVTSHQERGKTVSHMVCDCILTNCSGGYFKLKES